MPQRRYTLTRLSSRTKTWFWQRLDQMKIGKKISLGYIATLGIAVVGTIIGIAIGEYYYLNVKERQEDVKEEVQLIKELQSNLSLAQLQERTLSALLQQLDRLDGNSIGQKEINISFSKKYAELQKYAKEADRAWSILKTSYSEENIEEDAEEIEIFKSMLRDYDDITQEYAQLINNQVATVETATGHSPNPAALQRLLAQLDKHSLSPEFHEFIKKSEQLFESILEEEREVEADLQKVQQLKTQIIVISLMLSVAIAVIVAVITQRFLVRPIEATTRLARQVTQEDNFDLQAPVLSRDEIGILTTALNELIQRVKNLMIQQKAAELQLVQSEKMSGLGQIVAGVAHEINNPLNFIHGNLIYTQQYACDLLRVINLYQQEYPHPSKEIQAEIDATDLEFLQEDLSRILNSMKVGSNRIREIVKSLQNFSRLDESEIKIVNIHEGIDSTLMLLQNRLREKPDHPGIEVIKQYDLLPCIECYPYQLNQVFMNLINNAIDALDEKNQRRSREEIETNPSLIRICTELLPNDWIRIQIIDNGSGIPENIRSRLFDPFFTTKPVGKGTGLGLSVSYQIIVQRHGGNFYFNSTLGQGTEFTIEIPIARY